MNKKFEGNMKRCSSSKDLREKCALCMQLTSEAEPCSTRMEIVKMACTAEMEPKIWGRASLGVELVNMALVSRSMTSSIQMAGELLPANRRMIAWGPMVVSRACESAPCREATLRCSTKATTTSCLVSATGAILKMPRMMILRKNNMGTKLMTTTAQRSTWTPPKKRQRGNKRQLTKKI